MSDPTYANQLAGGRLSPEIEPVVPVETDGPVTGRFFTHAYLENLYGQCRDLNEMVDPAKDEFFAGEFEEIADVINQTEGVAQVYGLGYPFYAQREREDGIPEIVPVPEITRFVTGSASLIRKDRENGVGAWACAACQHHNDLPDLKTHCKPCGLTDLKPREPFKVLPDLDIWVVVEDIDDDVCEEVSSNLAEGGFVPSDEDIYRSLRSTDAVLKSLLRYRGKVPLQKNVHLPVDVHVIDIDTFRTTMFDFIRDPRADAPFYPHSLRVGWHKEVEPVDFAFDFVFSLSEVGNPKTSEGARLSSEVQLVRRKFASWLDEQGMSISEYLVSRSQRAKRILDSVELREIAEERIESWRSDI